MSPNRSATAFQTRGAMIVCVDADQEAELTANQNIRSVLTMSLFKDGQDTAEQTGLVSQDRLREMISNTLP
jgi:thioredoxin-like negative regulator of GroEL